MPQPYNYRIDVQSPIEDAIRIQQAGQVLNTNRMEAQELMRQRQEAQRMQQEAFNFAQLSNPTVEETTEFMVRNPKYGEAIKQKFQMLNSTQQESEKRKMRKIYGALRSGNVDLAKEITELEMEAAENSNDPERAAGAKALLKMIGASPQETEKSLILSMASVMEPTELEGILSSGAADEISQEDILKVENLKLKNEKLGKEISNIDRERINEAEAALKEATQAKSIIDDLLKKENRSVLKKATGKAAFRGNIPGTKPFDAKEKINQVVNLMAKGNLSSLKGALSEKELDFVKNISARLNRYQSEDAFLKELQNLQKLSQKAIGKLSKEIGSGTNDPLGLGVLDGN